MGRGASFMPNRTIPVAYVTKWAATAGIVIYRDVEVSEGEYLWTKYQSISPNQWTDDRNVAEGRWRQAIIKAATAAEKKASRLREMASKAPPYTDRSKRREGW